jgi:hypothetical protein
MNLTNSHLLSVLAAFFLIVGAVDPDLIAVTSYTTPNCTGGNKGCQGSTCVYGGDGFVQVQYDQCTPSSSGQYWKIASKSGDTYAYSVDCSSDCTTCDYNGSSTANTCVQLGTSTSIMFMELVRGNFNISYYSAAKCLASATRGTPESDVGTFSKCVLLPNLNRTMYFARGTGSVFNYAYGFDCDVNAAFVLRGSFSSTMGTRQQFSSDTVMCHEFDSCPWNETAQIESAFLLSAIANATTTNVPQPSSINPGSTNKPMSTTKRVLIGIMVTAVIALVIGGFAVIWWIRRKILYGDHRYGIFKSDY